MAMLMLRNKGEVRGWPWSSTSFRLLSGLSLISCMGLLALPLSFPCITLCSVPAGIQMLRRPGLAAVPVRSRKQAYQKCH